MPFAINWKPLYGRRLVFLFALLSALLTTLPAPAESDIRKVSEIETEDYRLVKHLFADKRYRFAKEEAESYLQKYPQGPFRAEMLFIQAQIEAVQGNLADAGDRYGRIVTDHRDSPLFEDALYRGGIVSIRQGDAETAKSYFARLEEKFPASRYRPEIEYALGKLAFDEAQWGTAEKHFQTVVDRREVSEERILDAERLLAWSYYFLGKREMAVKRFVVLLDREIDDDSKARIGFQLGIEAYKDRQYDRAIYWHERQMKQWPHEEYQNRSRFWIAEAIYAIYQQPDGKVGNADRRKAIELYGINLSEEKPIEPETSRLHLAWLHLSLKQYESAEREFETLQKNSPAHRQDFEITLVRADLNLKMERWAKALELYTAVQNGDQAYQNDLEIRLVRADLMYRLKQWPKAIGLTKRIFATTPEKKKDYRLLANVAKASEHLNERETYDRWKKEMPNLKPIGFFDRQATRYYESAYKHIPQNDSETRLSLLTILIGRYEKTDNPRRTIFYYGELAEQVKEPGKRNRIVLHIAKLYLNRLKDGKSAKIWLSKLHAKGNGPVFYEASSMLYTIALEEKQYKTATAILQYLVKQPIKETKWYLPVHFKLAELYQMQELWQKAMQYYRVVADTKQDSRYRKLAEERLQEIRKYLKQVTATKAEKGK